MKKLKQKILIGLMLLSSLIAINGQTSSNINCKTIFTNSTSITLPGCSNLNYDIESALYIPNASMPTLQFRINFIFLLHPIIPTAYSYTTQSQIIADVNSQIAYLNSKFQTLGSTAPIFPPLNPGPTVVNPKIQFTLNNVYFITTTLAVNNSTFNPYLAFPLDTANTLNYYFYTDTINPGNAYAQFGQYAVQKEGLTGVHAPGTLIGGDLMLHELCHAFGFLNDHYTANTVIPSFPTQSAPVYNNMPFNDDPINKYYSPDDATYDLVNSYPCSASSATYANNNVMGIKICAEVLSAKQIAAFHYLVAKNITKNILSLMVLHILIRQTLQW